LLHEVTRHCSEELPSGWRNRLLAAELTAQVRHEQFVEVAKEVIDICAAEGVPVTLLKGISISEQHYFAPHTRPMTDIDVLVPVEAYEQVQDRLLRSGYLTVGPGVDDEDAYHGKPLAHPATGIPIEIHRGLFPGNSDLSAGTLFNPSTFAAKTCSTVFHGRHTRRLTDEAQLIYIASYWLRDLTLHRIHPTHLNPLFDAVFLLSASQSPMNWPKLLNWMDNRFAAAALYILLSFLGRMQLNLFPTSVLETLSDKQDVCGQVETRILHAMTLRYLVDGKPFTKLFDSVRIWDTLIQPGRSSAKLLSLPWNILFPPTSTDRYQMVYQLDRVKRLIRRL
jgi:hypothetical protein